MGASPDSLGSYNTPDSRRASLDNRRPRRRLAAQWIPVFGAIAVALIILGLVAAPIPHAYSLRVSNFFYDPTDSNFEGWANFPTMAPGSHVSGGWSTEQGVVVELTISGQGGTLYSAKGASGAFSFTSPSAWAQVVVYESQFGVNVSVSGTYWSPAWLI